MIDFHSHILPEMDDGSSSIEESLEMLELEEKQNVDIVCLTSHFYPEDEFIDDYLKRRQKSYKELINYYQGEIKLKLGAEIRYYQGLSTNKDLDKLCLEGTNLLLLELPFNGINQSMINEIISIHNSNYYNIVLAHIERYFHYLKTSELNRMIDCGIMLQVNAEALEDIFVRIKIMPLIKSGAVFFIGSDSHNLDSRKPNIEEGINRLKKSLDLEYLDFLNKRSYQCIEEEYYEIKIT